MRNSSRHSVLTSVTLIACACTLSYAVQPPERDADQIKNLIQNYAAVVNVEPINMELASQVWEHSPDVTFIHPLGHEHGWEEIKRDFYENTMEALFSERKLTPRDIHIHVYGDAAWAEFYWHFSARLRKGGTVETNGRETQIYHKTAPNRWALVHVHYSAMPALPAR